MSRQRTTLDSWESELIHRKKVTAKLQRIQTLQALLQEWESHTNPDHTYILELKAKLRSAQHQYEAMQP
jgi:hypothetical protein